MGPQTLRVAMRPSKTARITAHPTSSPWFVWREFSQYVEVFIVQTGYLVQWGHYEDAGARKFLHGHRIYRDLQGARGRIMAAATAVTGNPHLARDAVALFDGTGFPITPFPGLPEPL